jgi:hypothetical protein
MTNSSARRWKLASGGHSHSAGCAGFIRGGSRVPAIYLGPARLDEIENIMRQEMDAIGGELTMPVVHGGYPGETRLV